MSSVTTSARFSRALPVCIALVAAGWWVNASVGAFASTYLTARFAEANKAMVLVLPIFATACAWRSGVLRSYLARYPARRSRLAAVLRLSWPLGLAALVALAITWVGYLGGFEANSVTARMAAVAVLVMFSAGALGLAAGQVLPPLVALPIVATGSWMWIALPPGGANMALRNMNASFVGCCTATQQPASILLLASSVVAGIWLVGSMLLLRTTTGRNASVVLLVAVLASGFGFGRAATATASLTLLAVEPRQTAPTCLQRAITVCVWPENQRQLVEAAGQVATARGRMVSAGLAVPSTFSESPISPRGASTIDVSGSIRLSDRLVSLSIGLLPDALGCAPRADFDPLRTQALALGWLSTIAGVNEREITNGLGLGIAKQVKVIRSQSKAQQLAWFTNLTQQLATCAKISSSPA